MTALKLDHSKPPYYYISSVGNTNLYTWSHEKRKQTLRQRSRTIWLKFEFYRHTGEIIYRTFRYLKLLGMGRKFRACSSQKTDPRPRLAEKNIAHQAPHYGLLGNFNL